MPDSPNPDAANALAGILQPLLKAYEVLFLIARQFHPPQFEQVMAHVGRPDDDLKLALDTHSAALSSVEGLNDVLQAAGHAALQAFEGLRNVQSGEGELTDAFRAFRHVPHGLESLYALAAIVPPVSRFFLDPALRADATLHELAMRRPVHGRVGVMHYATEEGGEGERGGFWLYVPEYYTPDRNWPLVMALHGGSGTGHHFLWSWLRDARSRGAILVAPSSVGSTWALSGDDVDTPNLRRMLAFIQEEWNVDASRMLLTGMSDGGTFTYLSGLEEASPFTHIAAVAAAFHPLLVAMTSNGRMKGLPIHIVHGALDWMFPVTMAREAAEVLQRTGASVTYREIADLSHTYPREMNAPLLAWLTATNA